MNMPPVVSAEEWKAAREKLLVKEKELTRARDALAAERRRMPRMLVEKEYRFDGPAGPASLLDLFDGRRQLIVYRAFYEPGITTTAAGTSYPDRACTGCSFGADQVAHPAHLNARDTTLVYASRAPQAEIQSLKERMGWQLIPWYTITDDFDADFGVDEWHGHNAFFRDEDDRVYRTYFINSRGDGHHLVHARHDRARAPGAVGGLTGGLSADDALSVVELPRPLRRDRLNRRFWSTNIKARRSCASVRRGLLLDDLVETALTRASRAKRSPDLALAGDRVAATPVAGCRRRPS